MSGGAQQKNIVLQITAGGITTSTVQQISGWSAGNHTTMLTSAPGTGFRSYLKANPRAPLYFSKSYGAFLDSEAAPGPALYITVKNTTVFGVQIQARPGDGINAFVLSETTNGGILDSNIIVRSGATHNAPGVYCISNTGKLLAQRNLIVGTDRSDAMMIYVRNGCALTSYRNALIMQGPATLNQGAAIFFASGGVPWPDIVTNTAAMGMGRCSGGMGGENSAYDFSHPDLVPVGRNYATCFPAPAFGKDFATNIQVNARLNVEFVNSTGPNYDYHINTATSRALWGNGSTSDGLTTDMVGNPINAPFSDIGPINAATPHP